MMRVLIVEARFYPEISDELYEGAAAALKSANVTSDRVEVPGALEIPAAIKLAAGQYDGFVALGCVMRGETYHFEVVSNESASGLMRVQLDTDVPVFSAVLTPRDFHDHADHQHFYAEHFKKKGVEVAQACMATLDSLERLPALPR